jgi:hypothetical protein
MLFIHPKLHLNPIFKILYTLLFFLLSEQSIIFADIKKPPVGYPMEADAVVALRPHSLMGYHLAQLQVGGASALSKCYS